MLAVESACQLAAGRPGFNRVHDTALVKSPVDPTDLAVDPSAGAPAVSAAVQNVVERRIDADLDSASWICAASD